MFVYDCTYENFNGVTVKETLYFNFTRQELMTMSAADGGSLLERYERILNTKDSNLCVEEISEIVLMAYGKRSTDGNRFYKNEEIREDFKASPAFDEVYMKLFTDPEFSERFYTGILPKGIDLSAAEEALKERGIVGYGKPITSIEVPVS